MLSSTEQQDADRLLQKMNSRLNGNDGTVVLEGINHSHTSERLLLIEQYLNEKSVSFNVKLSIQTYANNEEYDLVASCKKVTASSSNNVLPMYRNLSGEKVSEILSEKEKEQVEAELLHLGRENKSEGEMLAMSDIPADRFNAIGQCLTERSKFNVEIVMGKMDYCGINGSYVVDHPHIKYKAKSLTLANK